MKNSGFELRCFERDFSVERRHRKNVIAVITVLPHHIYRPHGITVKFSPPRGNYRVIL